MSNPFNISFGQEPENSVIIRQDNFDEIVNLFSSSSPESKVMIISGPRGSGKTVLLSQIKNHFSKENNWICIDLLQFSNMLDQLAAKLYDQGKLKKLFVKKEFDFSFHGISLTIHGEKPINHVTSILELMFEYLRKKGLRVLVTIDDVASTNEVKEFVAFYQSLIREHFEVYLLMSGLFENISKLQEQENLRFLMRAPKVVLPSLSLRSIAYSYQNLLGLDENKSLEFAKLSKGYAYAYQLIGNYIYHNKNTKLNPDMLYELDSALDQNVYSLMWRKASPNEQAILKAMTKSSKVADILQTTKMGNSSLQVLKKRLYERGLVDISQFGHLLFALPRFKEFVEFQIKLNASE